MIPRYFPSLKLQGNVRHNFNVNLIIFRIHITQLVILMNIILSLICLVLLNERSCII